MSYFTTKLAVQNTVKSLICAISNGYNKVGKRAEEKAEQVYFILFDNYISCYLVSGSI